MSIAPEAEDLRAWIEATQSSVETWVVAQEPDFAEVEASLHDAGPDDLLSWVGPGPSFDIPSPDITNVETRMASMRDADEAASAVPVRDAAVADAAADVRAVVERRVESRFPGARSSSAEKAARRTGALPWLLAAGVLAASVIGVLWVQGSPLEPSGTGPGLGQAVQLAVERAETGTSRISDPEPKPAKTGRPRMTSPSVEEQAVPTLDPAPLETRRPAPRRPSLQALADNAQALWREGDRSGAQSALMEIVRRGGRTPRVELAYADLFTLARQRGETRKRIRLYQSYLRRFPKGRLAEDARAGLCRTSGAVEQAACWRGYLERYSSGSYRAEAKAAQ